MLRLGTMAIFIWGLPFKGDLNTYMDTDTLGSVPEQDRMKYETVRMDSKQWSS